ncbi:MAG: hypothetical protein ABIG63_19100 [Chloroflexota bacterium]
MNAEHFLFAPENQEAIRAISLKVVAEAEPDQSDVSVTLINPLVDMAARGDVAAGSTSDRHGGFNGVNSLLIVIIVPLVTAVMDNLLDYCLGKVGEASLSTCQFLLRQNKDMKSQIDLTIDNMAAKVQITLPASSSIGMDELKKIVRDAILDHLKNQ